MLDEVRSIAAREGKQFQRYGGSHGLRDAGALDAALYRPQSGYYRDVIAEAAALFESLAMNHPFVDGNKRVAFACVDVFLRVDGLQLRVKPMAVHRWIVDRLESRRFHLAEIEPYLRKHARRLEP